MSVPQSNPQNVAQAVSRHRLLLIAVALTAAIISVYGQITRFDFVFWDDDIHVFNNSHLLSPAALAFFWRHTYEDLYIPVAYTAFFVLAKLAEAPGQPHALSETGSLLNPHVFHAAGLVLHIVNALLVLVLLRRVVRSDVAAGAGAALFALHPVQVESVAWISELRGLLAASFALCSLILLIKAAVNPARGQVTAAFGATALFLLALLCKPSAVCLPLLAGAFLWTMSGIRFSRVLWTALGAWSLLSIAFVLITRAAQPVPAQILLPVWQRPLVAADALAFYLGKLIWPWPLGIDYGRTPGTVVRHSGIYFVWLVPTMVALAAWSLRRRARQVTAGAMIFAAALLPVLGLVPFGFQYYSTVADRYLYLAMLGPALAAAWLLTRRTRAGWIGAAVVLFVWSVASFHQARTWRDSFALFTHAVSVNPRSLCAHTNLAGILAQRGDLGGALVQEEIATRLSPTNSTCWTDIGSILNGEGRYQDAIEPLHKAVRLNPRDAAAYTNLSNALTHAGQLDEAVEMGRLGVSLSPNVAAAHTVYGLALETQGRRPEAILQFQSALQINPNSATAQAHLQSDLSQTPP